MNHSAKKLSKLDYRAMPWKNGGGQTLEIAIHPPSATVAQTDFLWRLSSATIQQDGEFSVFPGYERALTLIDGKVLQVQFESQAPTQIKATEVFQFSGDQKVSCKLTDGPVTDLNLIFDKARFKGELTLVKLGIKPRSFQLDGETTFLYAMEGQIEVALYPGEQLFTLSPGETLWLDQGASEHALALLSTLTTGRIALIELNSLLNS